MSSPENTSSAADKSHALAQQHRNGPATLPGGSDSLPQELKGTCSGFQRTHPEEIPQQETLLPAICYELSERDLPTLTQCLETAAPAWTTIGDSLGFLPGEIKIISNSPPLIPDGPRSYFRELLSRWLKWAPPNHSLPTIETLASALRKAGEERLAFDLPNVKQRKELSTVGHSSDTQPEKSSAVPVRLSSKDQKQTQAPFPPPKPLGPSPSFSTRQLDSDAESESQRVGTIMQKIREFEKRFNSLKAVALTAVEDAKHIVNQYGEQKIQQTMEAYVNDLKRFRQSTPLRLFCKAQPRRHLKVPPDFRKLVTKHRKSWLDCTLEDVEQFRQEFVWKYDLRQVTLILREMGLGSIVITWWIPASVAPYLKERIQSSIGSKFLTEQGILEISISAQPESSEPKWFILPNEQEGSEQAIAQKLTPTMEMEGELVEQGTSLYLEGEILGDELSTVGHSSDTQPEKSSAVPVRLSSKDQKQTQALSPPPKPLGPSPSFSARQLDSAMTPSDASASSEPARPYSERATMSDDSGSGHGEPFGSLPIQEQHYQQHPLYRALVTGRDSTLPDEDEYFEVESDIVADVRKNVREHYQQHPLYQALVTGRDSTLPDKDEYFEVESDIIADVRKNVRDLEAKYARIVLNTHVNFKKRNVPVRSVRIYLNELSVSLKETAPGFSHKTHQLLMRGSLDEIFIHLRKIGAWDFLNFYILDKLIEQFGDEELKVQIRDYGKEVESFKQNTKLIVFLRVWSGRTPVELLPDCKPLIVRHKEDWKTYTLADIDKLEGNIASEFHLNRWIFNLSNAGIGSVFLMWLIPESAAELIKKTIKEEKPDLTKMNIQLLIIGDECWFKDYSVPTLPWMEESYEKLYPESEENREKFWGEVASEYLQWQKPFRKVTNSDFISGDLQWFLGGKLNVSENCLDRHDPDKTAIIWEKDEPGQEEKITYRKLLKMTCQLANVLKNNEVEKVQKGDRVVIYMPTYPLVVAAMLACARIGAVHYVAFSSYDAEVLRSKIRDTKAKVIITTDGKLVGGKPLPMKGNVDRALQGKKDTNVKLVLVANRTGQEVDMTEGRDIQLLEAMQKQPSYCPPEPLSSEDPLFIMYTSGTSDHPKCIVHTQAGYLLYAAVTHKYLFNYQEREIFCCIAGLGWTTSHTYVVYGPLCNGATTVLFEGTPDYPDYDRFWEMIDRLQINHFYTIPSVLKSLMKAGDEYVNKHKLDSLKTIASAGEPLNPATREWFYKTVGRERCLLLDTWWQTETGGIAITRWSAPEGKAPAYFPKKKSFPFFTVSPVLLDEQGQEVQPKGDAQGHLGLRLPFPGMGRKAFVHCGTDTEDKFKEIYLSKFSGLYYTYDLVRYDADGDLEFIGRSDDAVRIKGVWLDVPKIEGLMEVSDDSILEAVVIGHDACNSEDSKTVAFVGVKKDVKKEDHKRISALVSSARKAAADAAGDCAVPDIIFITDWRLTTHSGKVVWKFLTHLVVMFCEGAEEMLTLISLERNTFELSLPHMTDILKKFATISTFQYNTSSDSMYL